MIIKVYDPFVSKDTINLENCTKFDSLDDEGKRM